jgi:hypothetical protein
MSMYAYMHTPCRLWLLQPTGLTRLVNDTCNPKPVARILHRSHSSVVCVAAPVVCPCQVRYIRIKHLVNETGDWRKVYTWEIGAYGAGGRWGLPPTPQQQSRTFRQLLGVNGIWGWGNKSFSDTLAKQVRHLTAGNNAPR